MRDYEIRPARPDDAGAITHVQRTTWEATYTAWIPDVVAAFDPDVTSANWATTISDPAELVAVATRGGTVIGYAWSTPAGAGAELAALYVLPEEQGGGAGRLLVADALAWARAAGAGRCEVWALSAYAPALAFYERQGFARDLDTPARLWRGLPEHRYVIGV
ncbi:GNAT family N-acetyltransferase [Longispora albida]|uniref:GNAT family N-acetyltransferase n=1 Tax=Longispora albida TaxID=203523 RepID=UPI000371F841|nr:GNAT family N-acetyltransferase [Longispora albida]